MELVKLKKNHDEKLKEIDDLRNQFDTLNINY
jgi:hypothetical protein